MNPVPATRPARLRARKLLEGQVPDEHLRRTLVFGTTARTWSTTRGPIATAGDYPADGLTMLGQATEAGAAFPAVAMLVKVNEAAQRAAAEAVTL